MQIGMVGLGRMGANMTRRLMRGGHAVVVSDQSEDAIAKLVSEGAIGAASPKELAWRLTAPRAVWLMIPAGAVDATIDQLVPHLAAGDVVIDGGNSHHADDLARSKRLAEKGIDYVDVGVSGGVWGLERGYCLMIGGRDPAVDRLAPVFTTLAPGGLGGAPASAKQAAPHGWLHCGPPGAGHFVKMVHNGIEYGMMAAFAEGLNLLAHANAGEAKRVHDAETTPLRHPEHYRYSFDIGAITELWRHGSVVSSWLLDLTAASFAEDPALSSFKGRVSDSGEGRWTLQAAIDVGAPAHVLAAALFERFASRGEADFQNRVLSAMRYAFGGHLEKK